MQNLYCINKCLSNQVHYMHHGIMVCSYNRVIRMYCHLPLSIRLIRLVLSVGAHKSILYTYSVVVWWIGMASHLLPWLQWLGCFSHVTIATMGSLWLLQTLTHCKHVADLLIILRYSTSHDWDDTHVHEQIIMKELHNNITINVSLLHDVG